MDTIEVEGGISARHRIGRRRLTPALVATAIQSVRTQPLALRICVNRSAGARGGTSAKMELAV